MKRHRLLAFFLITFGISWGIPAVLIVLSKLTGAFEVSLKEYSALSYLVIWSPAISAFTVISITQGWDGIRAYAKRFLQWKVGIVWYAAALLGIPLLNVSAAALTEALGRDALTMPTVSFGVFLVAALLRATEGPFEEFGWHGFALPMLQRRFSGLVAALVLGFIWALWHVPAIILVIGRSIGDMTEGSMTFMLRSCSCASSSA